MRFVAKLKIIKLLIVLAIPSLLQGCSPEVEEPPIQVTTSYWIGSEPFFQAEALGFFPKGSVHLIENPNAISIEQTMRGETLDALAMSLSRSLSYIEQGYDVSIVLILGWSNGADKILAKPTINSIKDIKGHRVGAETGTVNSYLVYRALQKNNLSLADIRLISLPNEGMEEAYLKNDIDVASVHARAATFIEKKGAKLLFDSASIPGEIMDVLVVRNKFLREHPKRVQQLIQGWLKAVDYMKKEHRDSPIIPYLMKPQDFEENKEKVLLASIHENKNFLDNGAEKLKKIIEKRQEFQLALGIEPAVLPPSFINNTAFQTVVNINK